MTGLIVAAALLALGGWFLLAAILGVRWHHGVLAFLVSLGGPWDNVKDSSGSSGMRLIGGVVGVAPVAGGVAVYLLRP